MSETYQINVHRDEHSIPILETDKLCRIWIVWKKNVAETKALDSLNLEHERYSGIDRAPYPEVQEIFSICTDEELAKMYLRYLTTPDMFGNIQCYDYAEWLDRRKAPPTDKPAAYIEKSLANHMLGETCVQMLKAMHDADNKDE